MNKVNIISDKNIKSKIIKSYLEKYINKIEFKKANVTIVIGGDGFMLNILKKILILINCFTELIQALMVF